MINKKSQGLTLVELLVTTSIILLISGVVLINYRTSGYQLALNRSADKIASDIRRTVNLSVSSEVLNDAPLVGYGIYFEIDKDFYVTFVDSYGTQNKEIPLEKGVFIKDLEIDSVVVSSLSLLFIPPDPKVEINGESAGLAKIIVSRTDDVSDIREISINKIGLVEIN